MATETGVMPRHLAGVVSFVQAGAATGATAETAAGYFAPAAYVFLNMSGERKGYWL